MSQRLQRYALISEIAGGIAVVLSVVYLAVQLADNNRLLRSQAHFNALQLADGPTRLLIEDRSLARLIRKCDQNPNVDEDDWATCVEFYFTSYNAWEYLYYQNLDGSIPLQLWRGADEMYRLQLSSRPGYARFWKERQVAFADPFKSYVTALFDSVQ